MSSELKVGIVGAGGICKSRHMPYFARIDGVRVDLICNRTESKNKAFAEEFGVPRTTTRWQDVVTDPQIDIVTIGTWPYMHCEVALAAFENGKHVLCQARMARDASEARTMLDAAKKAEADKGLRCTLVPPPHGLAVDFVMQDLIKDIGELRHVIVRSLGGGAVDPERALSWRDSFELSGYNIMALGIVHEVTTRWFGRPVLVTALTDTFVKERPLPDDASQKGPNGRPDQLAALTRLEGGATVTYELSGHAVHAGFNGWEVFGSEGTIRCAGFGSEIQVAKKGEDAFQTVTVPEDRQRDWSPEADLVRAVREGGTTEPSPTFEDGVEYMDFVEGVCRSADTGQTVKLPLEQVSAATRDP